MTHALRQSPSLFANNLAGDGTGRFAYGSNSQVITLQLANNKLNSIPFIDSSQIFFVKVLRFASSSLLVVGMLDGFQIWNVEGTRMVSWVLVVGLVVGLVVRFSAVLVQSSSSSSSSS